MQQVDATCIHLRLEECRASGCEIQSSKGETSGQPAQLELSAKICGENSQCVVQIQAECYTAEDR